MAENDKIKVVGYAQRVFYNNGIEYRNFTPDLVGNQITSDSNTALFTYGNFAITKNTEGRDVINYPSKPYSDFLTLDSIGGTSEVIDLVFSANVNIKLNIDNTKLSNFAYFGSSTEFMRVTLESIITKWPASIHVKPIDNQTYDGVYTIENYTYNFYNNTSNFKVKTNTFANNYDVIYNTGGILLNTYGNELRNLVVNYSSYNILYNNEEYRILNFTGSTNLYDDYVMILVNGNPFPTAVNQPQYITYHIKPNNTEGEKFFAGLEPFEDYLLNRLTTPKYKSTFDYQYLTDTGLIYNTSTSVVWPTSDGYNLDFSTNAYVNYVNELLKICISTDETHSDLMSRFLVSESISNFDTIPRCDGTEEETSGQKMNKTLKIYGREFDEVKKYIDGIAYANNVSYDKKNNAPDQMIKYIARVMGWQLTSSVIENDLLKAYLNVPAPSYSGYSRGLTAAEAEIELWRRLILNSAWLFKSKGTRKAVEFLFKFIGAPEGLINLNEYIYAAKNKIDIDSFESVLLENNYDTDLISYNVDSDGFPKTIADTPTMYFQKGGLWYRETGGANAATQINQGNNPHIGPYDGGVEYINQFRSLLPDFQPTVLTTSTFTTSVVELFTNYNNGLINNYSGDTYVGIETYSGVTLDDCFLYVADIISDPHPTAELTDCGCDLPTEDLSLIIDIKRDELTEAEQFNNCSIRISGYTYVDSTNTNFYNTPYVFNWNYLTYNVDGSLNSQYYVSPFISPTCCNNIVNGASYLYDEYIINSTTGKPTLSNSGYICCKAPTINPTPIPTGTHATFTNFGFTTPATPATPKTLVLSPTVQVSAESSIKGDSTVPAYRGKGCGCYIGCQWRLAGPLLGQMYTTNNEMYLKFVTPQNNWGTTGTPQYRVTVQSDSCFCPLNYTIPQSILDPYTNKIGYACRLTATGKAVLTLAQANATYGTNNSLLYQLFYQKSIGLIGCTGTNPAPLCNISLGPIPRIVTKVSDINVSVPQISNGVGPYAYLWEIITQTGKYSNYGFLTSNTSAAPQIGPINATTVNLTNGTFEIKLTVTDSKGCKASTNATYIATV
jgi:hypothetical protein